MILEWLTRGYFVLNVLLYGALAFRTTLDPGASARSAGLTLGSASARSEYLVSQGGLLMFLAALFALFALSTESHTIDLKAAIALYAPILLLRLLPPALAGEHYVFSWAPTAIEAIMLLAAVVLLVLRPSS